MSTDFYPGIVDRNQVLISEDEARSLPGFEKSFALLRVWQEMKDTRKARRADLDPLVLGADLLPHLVLLDVSPDQTDFTWRIFGGRHEAEYGVNLAGVRLSELMPHHDGLDDLLLIFTECSRRAEPVFYKLFYESQSGAARMCTGVMLPLFGDDDATVTNLIGCTEWNAAP